METRVRFAPSPTGYVHIGSLRTALYNYLFAKANKGKYILRIEDTDQTRLVEGALENLIHSLEWAGLQHDEGVFIENGNIVQKGDCGPYIQSERLHIYKQYIQTLIDKGYAYPCFCSKERLEEVRENQKSEGKTPMYDRHCLHLSKEEVLNRINNGEEHVIRLKVPNNREIKFRDAVRGEISIHSSEIDDQVLIKSDGFPTYHFAVVVDDHLMGISHVVRGEEWLTSTPKQAVLYEYYGWDIPEFVHLPTVLNKDKKKLSKRQGDVSVSDYIAKGYLAEGLVNYLALVGWSPKENKELFTLEELIEEFSFDRVSSAGGVFDIDKLNWINAHYIKKADLDLLFSLARPHIVQRGLMTEDEIESNKEWVKTIISVLRDKISHVSEITLHMDIFFGDEVAFESEEVIETLQQNHVGRLLNAFKAKLSEVETVDSVFAGGILGELKNETGAKGKALFMPVRAAVTGQLHGPDLETVFMILGKELLLKRIDYVMKILS
ncbi:MAG: glutamate--tRNA ligase [Tissierellales bacterium]|nr:glutamate--tRNA ligase [Tissierellales bacterium]MBN2827867.1 glutamate--tRNA ligase [Tissierellales bacterium]